VYLAAGDNGTTTRAGHRAVEVLIGAKARIINHRYRRLLRDYEITETSAEAWVLIAMIRIQLHCLA
jgi:hypothetical protein